DRCIAGQDGAISLHDRARWSVAMTLSYLADTSAANWLLPTGTPSEQLIFFGPAGYQAYARLRFIPDPTGPGQDEGDADIPEDHPSDISQARRALLRLA